MKLFDFFRREKRIIELKKELQAVRMEMEAHKIIAQQYRENLDRMCLLAGNYGNALSGQFSSTPGSMFESDEIKKANIRYGNPQEIWGGVK